MNRYRLTGRLESSELSELYAALRGDDEAVVIKLFHARTSDVRYALELAETARRLAPVRAPGIVRIVDVGLVKDRLAVVRQAVDGIDLGQLLRRLTAREFLLSPTVAVGLVVQLLELLHAAHEARAVHGALTPGNVLLTPAGLPAVFDFGALRALSAVPALRRSYGARGRDAYRAPEVVKGDAPVAGSDVYSAGAILYELLTLREPLAERTSGTLTTRTHAVPPPSRLDRRLDARLDPIVLRALELSATRRYHSAREFAHALRNFLANNGGLPPPDALRRMLETMRVGDATLNLGPVPFSEPFTLREVHGAGLAPVTEATERVEPRPSFSGPRPSDVVDGPPAEPPHEAGTDPGQGGPLERGGDAAAGPPPRPALAPPWKDGLEVTRPLDAAALPRDTDEQPLEASERLWIADTRRQRRRLYVLLAVAAAGGLAVFLGLERFAGAGVLPTLSEPPPASAAGASPGAATPPTDDPALRTVNGALRRYVEAAGETVEAAPEEPDREEAFHRPPRDEDAAFLSLTADVPSVVYIDDLRVRRAPPLMRYPVEPGVRRILIESAGGERRSFDLAFEKGQLRKLDEHFGR